jgi:PKD repeat protein
VEEGMSKLLLVILLATLSLTSWGKNWKSTPKAHLETSLKKCKTPCEVKFDARKSKSKKGKEIEEYLFTFGDGKVLKTSSPVVTYTYKESSVKKRRNNHYRASLRVKDANGNWSKRVFRQIKVQKGEEYNAPPVSSFSYIPLEPVAGDLITLSSQATDDKAIASYEWIISDGRILFGEIVGIVFDQAGAYTVTHKVADEDGLFNEVSAAVVVSPKNIPPVASLTANVSGNGPFEVTLDSSGSTDDDKVVEFVWFLDEQFLGTTSTPIFYHQIINEGAYKFKVKVIDGKGFYDTIETVLNIEKLIPEGIFISGDDSIDLIQNTLPREYFFYVKENENDVVASLEGMSISMLDTHPNLSFSNNRLLVHTDESNLDFPESITLSVFVDGLEYIKKVWLNKQEARLIGVIPEGVTSYKIVSKESHFNEAIIKFTQVQSFMRPIEVYETVLSNGKIALNLRNSEFYSPIEYTIDNVSSKLVQAIDKARKSHKGLNEVVTEYEAYNFDEQYTACSYVPNVYYVEPQHIEDIKKSELATFPLYYHNYNHLTASELELENEGTITSIIQEFSQIFTGVKFVFYTTNDSEAAAVYPYFGNVVWVNLSSKLLKDRNNSIGVLLHELSHIRQFKELGCHEGKLTGSLRGIILESNAEYEAMTTRNAPLVFSSGNYALNTVYTGGELYLPLMKRLYQRNGLSDESDNAYLMGHIWDHLSFSKVTSEIKQSTILGSGKASQELQKLLTRDEYFNFFGQLAISNYYPKMTDAFFSEFLSSLYLEVDIPETHFYSPTSTKGTAQKIDLLKPFENKLNIIDIDRMTLGMDEQTKKNLRFKFLVYPSEDENLVKGFEDVNISLSGVGNSTNRQIETLWSGNGVEPTNTEFLIDFNKFDSLGQQIQVLLLNSGSSQEALPIITTLIPEIRKEICYFGPSSLEVTFMHEGQDHLADYPREVRGVVPTGTCKDFYLIYKVGYFYELLVSTSDPQAVGYEGNWSQKNYDNYGNGFVYNFMILNNTPMIVTAEIEPYRAPDGSLPPIEHRQYYIDLSVMSVSANSILVY